jgi:hypothetical protein
MLVQSVKLSTLPTVEGSTSTSSSKIRDSKKNKLV